MSQTATLNEVPDTQVAIVLCTYNGTRYLAEQLSSLLNQTQPVFIIASDDKSSDETASELVKNLRSGVDHIYIRDHNQGYVANFESTIQQSIDSGASYIALSDQDDIWSKDRVSKGMAMMRELEKQHGLHIPLLVHSDLRLVNSEKQQVHSSFIGYRRYRINNQRNLAVILGENGVMGNTILMNQAMANLCIPFPEQLHVHDYWIALLAELFGHRAMLDMPLVDYRLHTSNASNTESSMRKGVFAMFSNTSVRKLIKRDFKLPFKEDTRLIALEHLLKNAQQYPEMSNKDRKQIEAFISYLEFKQPRLRSFLYLTQSNLVRKGLKFRLRLLFITLTTARYPLKV